MPTSTVENYVKQLYLEQQRLADDCLVPLGRLALALNVVPGTVTTMVRTLADANLVHYEPRAGVRLSDAGEKLALHVLRRHRLVELFLVKSLGFDWSEVHEEAEELEHVISDKLLERIDDLLGRPSVDPHGDPIPDADGQLPPQATRRLCDCEPGDAIRIERVHNQDAAFLKMANGLGLTPGTEHVVDQNDRVAGTLQLSAARAEGNRRMPTVIGSRAAECILVHVHEAART